MKYFLILFFLISPNAFAGISVCHGVSDVTLIKLRGNRISGCEFYDPPHTATHNQYNRIKNLKKTVELKFIKWDSGLNEPVEMNQTEKDAVLLAEANAQDAALRTNSKTAFNGQTETGQAYRALIDVILKEINTLRALHSLPDRTLAQAKTAIQNAIDNGDVDE